MAYCITLFHGLLSHSIATHPLLQVPPACCSKPSSKQSADIVG